MNRAHSSAATADVVIVGAGVMGASIAFQLVKRRAGKIVVIDKEHPGDNAHSVAVDPSTHHVFFPLVSGPNGTPVLRIMRPAGGK